MKAHICTTGSLRAGCEDIPAMICPVCNNKTMFADWVSSRCDTCGADTEGGIAYSYRIARYKTGLNRKQFAEKMGLKPSTISSYDFCPSASYLKKAQSFIRDHFAQSST